MRRSRLATVGIAALLAIAVVAGIVVIRSLGGGDARSLPSDVGVVDWIIDGDTINIEIVGRTERVRLIGINTPEIAHQPGDVDECFGPEATTFLAGQLPIGTEVRLVRDVVGRDDYGRLLAYVYRRADDLFVNEAIIAGGYARPLSIAPNVTFADRFVAAATAADAADLGLWAACAG